MPAHGEPVSELFRQGHGFSPPLGVILGGRRNKKAKGERVNFNKSMIVEPFFYFFLYFYLHFLFTFFIFFHPIYYPRLTFELPPSSNSDPGSHSGPSSPLSTTVRAFMCFARRTQHFLPSSTCVELCLPTLLGALNS